MDSFDDRYLGTKSSDPTVDNDGNALAAGALYFSTSQNVMKVYDGASWITATSAGATSLLQFKYVATAGQTTFSGTATVGGTLTYTVNNIVVFLNGVALDSTDYTASTGTSIVLGTAAALNDELVIIAFKSFTVADTYTKGEVDGFAVKLTGNQTVAGTKTFSSNPVLDAGTANGVAYLNGSKVLTTGSALVFDGTNLGLGVTPATYSGSGVLGFNIANTGNGVIGNSSNVWVSNNVSFNSGFKYARTAAATLYNQSGGAHVWSYAASGTAGNAITFTDAMTLDASANLLVGVTSNTNANNRLYVVGPLASYTSSATTLATSATSASVRLSFAQDSSQSIFMGMATDGTNYPSYIQAANGGGTTASNLTLQPFGGNLLVGGATATDYKLRVNGTSHFGDGYDNGVYGQVAITRPANQGTQFHLAFVRQGTQVSGMGFLNNSSTFAIQNASTNAGSGVTLAVNGTSWGTTSDERTKDILGGVDNALQKLSNWRTVYFKYKTDAEAQTQRVGLIAQDVQATLPEAVSIEEDEIKTLQLRYTEVIPVLVKAIQEQQALITTLTARITALEAT